MSECEIALFRPSRIVLLFLLLFSCISSLLLSSVIVGAGVDESRILLQTFKATDLNSSSALLSSLGLFSLELL